MDDSDSLIWEYRSRDRVFDAIRDKILAARDQGRSLKQLMQLAAEVLLAQTPAYRDELFQRDLVQISLLAQHGLRAVISLSGDSTQSSTGSLAAELMNQLTADEPPEPELSIEEMREKVRRFRTEDGAEAQVLAEAHKRKRRKRGLCDQAGEGKPAPAVKLYRLAKRAGKGAIAGDEEAKLLAALEALPLGHSRIGGLPDLPRKKRWPEHKGKKLPFIAQVNLAQLPKAAHSLLPRDGHLYVFARISNAETQWPPPVSIYLYRGKADALVRSTLPKKGDLWPAWKDALVYEVVRATGKSGGESVGWLYGKINRAYATAGELADQEFFDGDDWINLLGIKSVGSMQWSDEGDLNVIIRQSSLEKLDFSNVLAMALSS